MLVAAAVGLVSGLLSSLPSPLPDFRLSEPDILISARTVPLHAGIVFGACVALMLWLWVSRDLGKCLLAMGLTLLGWLAAVNTANDVLTAVLSSELYGTAQGAKAAREALGWLLGGAAAGAIGAGLTAFGAGIPAESIRRGQAWGAVVVTGALLGLLLYPAMRLDTVALLFLPWQAAVAASIAYGLTLPRA
jgi:hypothetical protein